jgi:hypothetical protein
MYRPADAPIAAELLQQPGVDKDFGSYILGQFLKLQFKLIADFRHSIPTVIMAYNTYGLKIISDSGFLGTRLTVTFGTRA